MWGKQIPHFIRVVICCYPALSDQLKYWTILIFKQCPVCRDSILDFKGCTRYGLFGKLPKLILADWHWQWHIIWWRQCHCQSHNCGQSPFRLFIGVAIRDIRYRTQWRISIFSFTCHRLLRAVPMLNFSRIAH